MTVKPNEVTVLLERSGRIFVEDPTTPAPGADAFRWFFYAASPPWTNTRHSLANVRAMQKDFQIKLRNVYSFFTIYATIDRWSPAFAAPLPAERPLIDRWLLSELALLNDALVAHMDAFEIYEAAQKLMGFVEGLSNWYVRRSRERFWGTDAGDAMGVDKRSAYATLHHCLATLAKLIAPFVPFFAEELYRGLVVAPRVAGACESVHLEEYPLPDESRIDRPLSSAMAAVRDLVSLGLQVRNTAKIKVRQPLRQADVVLGDPALRDRIEPYLSLIADELNVHAVRIVHSGEEAKAVNYRIKPNFRALGQKLGKDVQLLKKQLESADAGALRAKLVNEGSVAFVIAGQSIDITIDELDIAVEAAPGFAAAGAGVGVVVLHTTLDEGLLDEGLAREIQSRLQAMRKELGLGFTERVVASVVGGERVERVARANAEMLRDNVLIDRLDIGATTFVAAAKVDVSLEGEALMLAVARISLRAEGLSCVASIRFGLRRASESVRGGPHRASRRSSPRRRRRTARLRARTTRPRS